VKHEKYLPVVVIILDGFGEGREAKGNAITEARTPFLDEMREKYYFAALDADPKKLGIADLDALDSRTGHMILGAGRSENADVSPESCVGGVVSKAGLGQLRAAEVEKYGHVTKFFNCENAGSFKGESFALIIPDYETAHYDKTPEMNSAEVTRRLLREVSTGKYAFVVVNFGNADIVGHNRDFEQTVEAVEVIDRNLAEIVPVVTDLFGATIITSDHGMIEEKKVGGKETHNHTNNPVPFYLIGDGFEKDVVKGERKGSMYDVAPTILHLLNIKQPKEMVGKSVVS